jgi:hypothetical protein
MDANAKPFMPLAMLGAGSIQGQMLGPINCQRQGSNAKTRETGFPEYGIY